MHNFSFRATYHAQIRQAQRNLSYDDVSFVLRYGQYLRCAGVLHVFLGRRNIPSDQDAYRQYAHLEGTILVLDDTYEAPTLITVYRNRQGLKSIRSKAKYNRRSR